MFPNPVLSQHFNSLKQTSKRWKKHTVLYVRYWLKFGEFTRDIVKNYVSTFVIYLKFWFQENKRKIYQTLYVNFYSIIGCYFHRLSFIKEFKWMKFYVRSSCFITTFQSTYKNEEKVEEIANIICWISTGKIPIQN